MIPDDELGRIFKIDTLQALLLECGTLLRLYKRLYELKDCDCQERDEIWQEIQEMEG